jgi:hypothetical protein
LALIPAAAWAEDKKPDAKDPNRVICEKEGVVGSRLATKRVCMTAAEWTERKRADRESLEKAQISRTAPSGN